MDSSRYASFRRHCEHNEDFEGREDEREDINWGVLMRGAIA